MADASQATNEAAERLRVAFARSQEDGIDVMTGMYAPMVQVSHVPKHPSDGPYSGKSLGDGLRAEMSQARQSMPDCRFEFLGFGVKGQTIEMTQVREGTRAGHFERRAVRVVLTVEDGKITQLVAFLPPPTPANP